MAVLQKCRECGAGVSRARMARHLERVHGRKSGPERDEKDKKRGRASPGIPWRLIVGVLVIVVGVLIVYLISQPPQEPPEDQFRPHPEVGTMCISQESYHIHSYLHIYSSGVEVKVPAGIGTSPCIRPVHTHKDNGEIHVENDYPSHFTLGEFFDVWGQPFDSTQVLQYKAGNGHTLTMKVNGSPSGEWRALILRNAQQIEITYL